MPDQHRLTLDYSVFVNAIVNYPRQTANFIFNAFQIRQQTIMRKRYFIYIYIFTAILHWLLQIQSDI
jgi:hypothetical protein